MSTLNVEAISHPTSGSNATINGITPAGTNQLGNRNLIINGAMQVAQRGTSFTPATEFGYTLDRYVTFSTNTGSANLTQETSSPPEGHTTYARITSTGAASVTGRNLFSQIVEGQNLAPTKWGYSDAKDVTISFWVRSSLTGDFGFAVNDTNQNPCIVMKYNIASANTWEHKTLLIPATTSGDFGLTSSGRGCWLFWDLGTSSTHEYGTTDTWVDSNTKYTPTNVQQLITVSGATLDITGVQLEVGTVATPFERRSYGQELALCQRYYETCYQQGLAPGSSTSQNNILAVCPGNINRGYGHLQFQVKKRASATVTFYSTSGAPGKFRNATQGTDITMSAACSFGDSGISYETSVGIVGVTDKLQGLYTAEAEL